MIEKIRQFLSAGQELLFSRLGVSFVVFTLVYITLASFLPMIFLVEVANALVFAFALILAVIYIPDAIYVARNDKGEGGQYFLVGLSLVVIGLLEARAFASLWRWMGNPESWLNSPFNTFFLFLLAWGLITLVAAPGMKSGSVPIKNWRIIGLAIAFAIFVFGVTIGLVFSGKVKQISLPNEVAENYFVACPPERPIKGNKTNRGNIYHMPGSPDYDRTNPERCFSSEEEARANGFRLPRTWNPQNKQSLNDSLTFAEK